MGSTQDHEGRLELGGFDSLDQGINVALHNSSNAAGAVIGSRRYDAFGNLEVGATAGFSFTGREWDAAAQLAYYRARYYNPHLGRFISEDPFRWLADLNSYAYVRGNPALLTDPTGLFDVAACHRAQHVVWNLTSQVRRKMVPDKVGHCLAHCELTKQCGLLGKIESAFGGHLKEDYDAVRGMIAKRMKLKLPVGPLDPLSKHEWDDLWANAQGRTCPSNESCATRCKDAQTTFSSGF